MVQRGGPHASRANTKICSTYYEAGRDPLTTLGAASFKSPMSSTFSGHRPEGDARNQVKNDELSLTYSQAKISNMAVLTRRVFNLTAAIKELKKNKVKRATSSVQISGSRPS